MEKFYFMYYFLQVNSQCENRFELSWSMKTQNKHWLESEDGFFSISGEGSRNGEEESDDAEGRVDGEEAGAAPHGTLITAKQKPKAKETNHKLKCKGNRIWTQTE